MGKKRGQGVKQKARVLSVILPLGASVSLSMRVRSWALPRRDVIGRGGDTPAVCDHRPADLRRGSTAGPSSGRGQTRTAWGGVRRSQPGRGSSVQTP